jgi:hypothetical protein
VLARKLKLGCGDVVGKLLGLLGADDDARHEGLGKLPAERDARHGDAGVFGNLAERYEDARQAIHVHRRKIEGSAAGVRWALLLRVELAGQEAACERAPRQDGETARLAEGRDLAFDVSACDGVVDLCALKTG